MELWIRSQDRLKLVKSNGNIIIKRSLKPYSHDYNILVDTTYIGAYKNEERSLEVLDEIQNKIHQTFICELNHLVSSADYERIKSDLEVEYPNNEFIMQTQLYELKPINSNVVIYEMPKE